MTAKIKSPGALDKKRWVILCFSCLINLCIGSMYAWSSLSAPMAEELNANLSSVFSTANAVSFIAMIIGGLLNDKYGPRWVMFTGGVMFGLGMFASGKSLPLSIKMTKGYKKRFFVLDLSFIGWYLLCCLTLGIGMFWYVPYYTQTVIKAYNFIKKDALEKGIVAESDFTECSSEQIEDKTQNS